MICKPNDNNGYFYDLTIDANDLVTILRSLYWYEDKITNRERAKGRDDAEWDNVVFIRSQLSTMLRKEAKI